MLGNEVATCSDWAAPLALQRGYGGPEAEADH
jgi:hypothetical protein